MVAHEPWPPRVVSRPCCRPEQMRFRAFFPLLAGAKSGHSIAHTDTQKLGRVVIHDHYRATFSSPLLRMHTPSLAAAFRSHLEESDSADDSRTEIWCLPLFHSACLAGLPSCQECLIALPSLASCLTEKLGRLGASRVKSKSDWSAARAVAEQSSDMAPVYRAR